MTFEEIANRSARVRRMIDGKPANGRAISPRMISQLAFDAAAMARVFVAERSDLMAQANAICRTIALHVELARALGIDLGRELDARLPKLTSKSAARRRGKKRVST